MDRPIYDASIDPELQTGDNELGIDMIAFTSDPAILVKGVAFKSQKKSHFADDKKYRITAPAMIPMDIYRHDEDGEYDVRFKEESIDEMHKKFMSNLNNKDLFNLEHESEIVPAFILEAWIVDNPKQDKAFSTFGIEVPKGTLMVTAQVTDKDYYNNLVENEQVGFSIEGFLGLSIPKEQLNKYSMKLPDGEHTIDGSIYTVLDGEITNVVEVVAEEETSIEEEVVTDVVADAPQVEVAMEDEEKEEEEVEMAEDSEEEVEEEVEMEVNPETDSEAILAIVQPLIDEVLAVVADLQNEIANAEEVPPSEDAEVNMSGHVGFSRFAKAFGEQN